jgi:hypothetical protein
VLAGRGLSLGLFFDCWPSTACLAHPIRRTIGQGGRQFFAAAPDGFLIHTGDLGQQSITAVPDAIGLQGHKPTSLGFIEPTEQEIHLLMELPLRMIARLLTARTLADPNVE